MNKGEAWQHGINVIGRGCITILAAVGINKSDWYQETPGSIPLTDPWGWIVALGIIGCIVWMIAPILALGRTGE